MSDLRQLGDVVARELAAFDLARRADAGREASSPGAGAVRMGASGFASSLPVGAGGTQVPPRGVTFVRENARLADFVDHTLLKAEATRTDIDRLCDEALEHRFAAVCVNPVWVRHCASRLAGSNVAVATVIGFPLGASASDVKRLEAMQAVRDGATEIDMVAAIGHIKGGDWSHVADDMSAVVAGAGGGGGGEGGPW